RSRSRSNTTIAAANGSSALIAGAGERLDSTGALRVVAALGTRHSSHTCRARPPNSVPGLACSLHRRSDQQSATARLSLAVAVALDWVISAFQNGRDKRSSTLEDGE